MKIVHFCIILGQITFDCKHFLSQSTFIRFKFIFIFIFTAKTLNNCHHYFHISFAFNLKSSDLGSTKRYEARQNCLVNFALGREHHQPTRPRRLMIVTQKSTHIYCCFSIEKLTITRSLACHIVQIYVNQNLQKTNNKKTKKKNKTTKTKQQKQQQLNLVWLHLQVLTL